MLLILYYGKISQYILWIFVQHLQYFMYYKLMFYLL